MSTYNKLINAFYIFAEPKEALKTEEVDDATTDDSSINESLCKVMLKNLKEEAAIKATNGESNKLHKSRQMKSDQQQLPGDRNADLGDVNSTIKSTKQLPVSERPSGIHKERTEEPTTEQEKEKTKMDVDDVIESIESIDSIEEAATKVDTEKVPRQSKRVQNRKVKRNPKTSKPMKVLKREELLEDGWMRNESLIFEIESDNAEQLIYMSGYSFTLPDFETFSPEFSTFLEKNLIECSTLKSLETANRLNWWVNVGFCQKLWPLATTGDGNCLLHAASLAMWGFHDYKLTLRSALNNLLLSGEYKDAMWRRWRFQQTPLNRKTGLMYSEVEWAKEWESIVHMTSPEPRESNNVTYMYLEEIHIFALAHVLHRPIIVIADTVLRNVSGEVLAPNSFGSVYLPLEIEQNECHRAPLLLTYDLAHFSALVSMESFCSGDLRQLIPIVDFENELLPIPFSIDPGTEIDWEKSEKQHEDLYPRDLAAMLEKYLDIVCLPEGHSPHAEFAIEQYERRILKRTQRLHRKATVQIKSESATSLENRLVFCAQLINRPHENQSTMIENYLECSQIRYALQPLLKMSLDRSAQNMK